MAAELTHLCGIGAQRSRAEGFVGSRRHHFAQRRKTVGHSQEQLAQRLGVERSTVMRWEAGETKPQPWLRPKIAGVLQISLEQLDDLLESDAIEGKWQSRTIDVNRTRTQPLLQRVREGLLSAIFSAGSRMTGSGSPVHVSEAALTSFQQRLGIWTEADEAKKLLGIRQGDLVAYRHDSVHALYSGTEGLHPDNLRGLVAAAGNDYLRAVATGTLEITDVVPADIHRNLVLIGSPTAEGLSRPTFGYEVESGDPDSLVLANAPIELPYKWTLSKSEIDEGATASRYVAGKGLVTRPNWRIESDKRMFIPQVDSEGMLCEDYLLVTKVRNYLSQKALEQGQYIVSFGGSHGTATRALELLFEDRSTLRKIGYVLSKQPAAFQLLLRVGDMAHDKVSGTRAQKLELVADSVQLPDQAMIWQTAREVASANLQRWYGSQRAK